jgi:hypothetical protein
MAPAAHPPERRRIVVFAGGRNGAQTVEPLYRPRASGAENRPDAPRRSMLVRSDTDVLAVQTLAPRARSSALALIVAR